MKEILFAALIAVVAVGGTYAQQQYASAPFSAADLTCVGTETPLCGATAYFPYSDDQAPLEHQIQTRIPL